MNLRQIEVFRAIMITGSVSDAARLLHVSVPAVSRVLSYTESRLGFLLFERVKGRLFPTAEARQLYHEIELVYRGVQRIGHLTHELAARRRGILSIVSSPSIGQTLIPLAIARFHAANPEVKVNFQCLNHQLLQERLLSRQFDVGVTILPMDHPNLKSTSVAQCRLVCICAPDHPLAGAEVLTAKDLSAHRLITYPPETPFRTRVEQFFANADERLQIAMEVGSPQNACSLVAAGVGVALVDEYSLQAWLGANLSVVSVDDAPAVVADLVYLRTEPLSPAANAFIESLHEVLSARGFVAPPCHGS